MPLYAITGSATEDGRPIYRRETGEWTPELAAAQVYDAEVQRDAGLAEARREERVVCDPYAIEVTRAADGVLEANRLKERIRAHGPTVR